MDNLDIYLNSLNATCPIFTKLIDKSNSVFFTNTIEYGIQMRPQIAEAIKRFQR